MTNTHLVFTCYHATPEYDNEMALYIGKLMEDVKPTKLINLGDMADMASLCSYDKGKKSFHGRAYKKDIDATVDANEKLWHFIHKNHRRRPESYFFEGNHEYRIKKMLDLQPELEGTVGFEDLELDSFYNNIIEYQGQTPGVMKVDGINYAHYFVSGVMGRPVGGEHPAYSLLTKQYESATCGHIHVTDFASRTTPSGQRINGLVAGCSLDYHAKWAGEVNKLWWRGVIIKHNVDNGNYDPQWVSLDSLKKIYGGK